MYKVFSSATSAAGRFSTIALFKCPALRIASSTYFLFGTSVSFTGGFTIVRFSIAYPAAASRAATVSKNSSLKVIVPSVSHLKYEASNLFRYGKLLQVRTPSPTLIRKVSISRPYSPCARTGSRIVQLFA